MLLSDMGSSTFSKKAGKFTFLPKRPRRFLSRQVFQTKILVMRPSKISLASSFSRQTFGLYTQHRPKVICTNSLKETQQETASLQCFVFRFVVSKDERWLQQYEPDDTKNKNLFSRKMG